MRTKPSSSAPFAPRTSVGELSVREDALPISPERMVRLSIQFRSESFVSPPAKPP